MIQIFFEIGGRRIDPNQIGNVLEKMVLQQVAENIKQSLASVCCREHGQMPNIKVKGRNFNSLSFEVEGCCQDLIDRALLKLR